MIQILAWLGWIYIACEFIYYGWQRFIEGRSHKEASSLTHKAFYDTE